MTPIFEHRHVEPRVLVKTNVPDHHCDHRRWNGRSGLGRWGGRCCRSKMGPALSKQHSTHLTFKPNVSRIPRASAPVPCDPPETLQRYLPTVTTYLIKPLRGLRSVPRKCRVVHMRRRCRCRCRQGVTLVQVRVSSDCPKSHP